MSVQKLIFWDIDGTLLHCGSDGRKALNRTFFELYNIEDAFESSDIGGAMDSMILMGIMKSHTIGKDQLPTIIRHYQEVLADVLDNNKDKRILPGVPKLLETIHDSANSENALLTSNLRIGAMTKLNSLGLGHFFKLGGFGDEPGEKWDAAYACIREAEELYGTALSKDQIFLIGDSAYDILCAQKVGITSIAVGTGWTDVESLLACKPDHFFPDLSDTDQVLEAIQI
jgi:phosphoglycolate phosphatase